LPAPEVEVWIAELPLPARRSAALERHLSVVERARAARFRRSADRQRFVTARGLLREQLAERLEIEPPRVAIAVGDAGKPRLLPPAGAPDLRFNASHSGERVALVLAVAREVGIDVERVRAELDVERIAARTLSTSELHAWRALPAARRRDAFFAAWARKEAYAKGRGGGLAIGLTRVEPLPASGPGRFEVAGAGASPWTICDLDAGPGYAAAVAAEGASWEVVIKRLAAGRE
jgi:4'-phosphopantetheinyl transferase